MRSQEETVGAVEMASGCSLHKVTVEKAAVEVAALLKRSKSMCNIHRDGAPPELL